MIRVVLTILALIAPFVFPWPLTAVLALLASYFLPPVALLVGALMEFLYGVGGVPYALIAGLLGSLFMYGVQKLVKARIMGA